MYKKIFVFLVIIAIVISCSKSSDTVDKTVKVTGLFSDVTSITINEYDTIQLPKLYTAYTDGTKTSATANWSVDSTSNIEIIGNSLVGKKAGIANLTAKVDSYTYSIKATIQKNSIISLKITGYTPNVVISHSYPIDIDIVFASGTKIKNPSGLVLTSRNSLVTITNTSVLPFKSGTDKIVAEFSGIKDSVSLSISPIEETAVDSYLSTPASNSILTIPVIVVSYIPTANGIDVDVNKAPDYFSLNPISIANMQAGILTSMKAVKFAAEEGSKFRGYKTPVNPYVGIKVIKHYTLYEMPNNKATLSGSSVNEPDFIKIFESIGLKDLVNKQGVKEVWFNINALYKTLPSYNSSIHKDADLLVMPESNMSSPTSGDISNSYRNPLDLPIFDSTYVVYGFNSRGYFGDQVHLRSHQIEIQLRELDKSPNKELFQNFFTGIPIGGGKPIGRCGGVHFPPNALNDYEYGNTTFVKSDIETWTPSGGTYKDINYLTWLNQNYNWPNQLRQDAQGNWLIYWYQSIPGYNNNIQYNSYNLVNWWDLFYKWDDAVRSNKTLWK